MLNGLVGSLSSLEPSLFTAARTIEDRNAAIRMFKTDPDTKVLVATPGAAKEGLTLTVANHAIFYDRSFSLDDYLQAQDRIHRISQDQPCYIWNLICERYSGRMGGLAACRQAIGSSTRASGHHTRRVSTPSKLRFRKDCEANSRDGDGRCLIKPQNALVSQELSVSRTRISRLKRERLTRRSCNFTSTTRAFIHWCDRTVERQIRAKYVSSCRASNMLKSLSRTLAANGGLIDPLLVRDGDFVVLEGNSRLAAYRHLASKDPIKWSKVRCTVLPGNIDEKLVFALLGQYHIKGKKDWAPYEKAGFLYRRHVEHNIPLPTVALDLGVPKGEAEHLIAVYKFMMQHDDDRDHWSYYDEFLKSNRISKVRKDYAGFDKFVVEQVKTKANSEGDGIARPSPDNLRRATKNSQAIRGRQDNVCGRL